MNDITCSNPTTVILGGTSSAPPYDGELWGNNLNINGGTVTFE